MEKIALKVLILIYLPVFKINDSVINLLASMSVRDNSLIRKIFFVFLIRKINKNWSKFPKLVICGTSLPQLGTIFIV